MNWGEVPNSDMGSLLRSTSEKTGWLIGLDKKTEIKGDNHTAIIAILLVLPVSLGVHKLLGPGWRNNLLPGVVLIIAFSIWTGIAESKAKKAKFRKELT